MSETDGRTKRLLRAAAAPAAVAVVALAWLLWPSADPAVAVSNMDVLYHVHRVSRCLLDFPHVSSIDTYSHAGAPWHLHWPGPHALLYALIAKLLAAPAADILALAAALSPIPPILGAGAAASTVLLARQAGLREGACVLAGLACALSGDAVVVFHHGAIDHHAFTALLLPLAMLCWMKRSLAGWAACLVLLASTTPEATPYLTLLLGALAACEGWGASIGSRDRFDGAWPYFLMPAAAVAVALVLDRSLDPHPASLSELSPFRLSLFQVGWLGVIGIAGASSATLPRRARSRAERASSLVGLLLGSAALLLLTLMGTGRLGEIVDRLARTQRQQVGEELPLLRFLLRVPGTHWGAWTVLLILVAVAAFFKTMVELQGRRPPRMLAMSLVPLGATMLALLELRHARSLAPLIALAVVVACADVVAALRAALPGRRFVPAAAAAWLALIAVPPFAWHAWELRKALREPARWTAAIGPLCDWARDRLPDAGPRDAPPARAIFAPWEWGHHLNVLGQQPVVVDGFNHEEEDNRASWDVWLAETGDGMAEAAKAHGATHLVVTGAPGSIVGLLQRTPYEVVRAAPDLPGGALWMPSLRRHAAFRLDEAGGIADEAGRLLPLWVSEASRPLAVDQGDRAMVVEVPAARLFEIVAGATIRGTAPPATSLLTVETAYVIGQGPERRITRRIPVDGAGRFEFRTSLPAPWIAGPLRITGVHRLEALMGEARIAVTVDAVRRGAVLDIPAETFAPRAGP